jgi:hypothetical protein
VSAVKAVPPKTLRPKAVKPQVAKAQTLKPQAIAPQSVMKQKSPQISIPTNPQINQPQPINKLSSQQNI